MVAVKESKIERMDVLKNSNVDLLIFVQILGPVQIQVGEEYKNKILYVKGQSQTLYDKGKCHNIADLKPRL